MDGTAGMLHGTTDAAVWAKEFMRLSEGVEVDEGMMISWFANAIETGRDAGLRAESTKEYFMWPGHFIEFDSDGWSIQHPSGCRPDLLACPFHRWTCATITGPPASGLGRYVAVATGDGYDLRRMEST